MLGILHQRFGNEFPGSKKTIDVTPGEIMSISFTIGCSI